MLRILLQLTLIITLAGCYTQKTTSDKKENNTVVVTNIVAETEIIGSVEFTDVSKDLLIRVKPIDTRKFEAELFSAGYRDGRHKSVFSSIDIANNEDKTEKNYDFLINELLSKGLAFNDIRLIIEAIEGEKEASEALFVYSDSEIYFSDDFMVNKSNPFSTDGRYLSVVEIKVENNSGESEKLCDDDIVFKSGDVIYKNIPTIELLGNIPSTSLRYELLHKLLMRDCETIPANAKITTHLVYPSFYYDKEVTVYYNSLDSIQQDHFTIENNIIRDQYHFSVLKVEGSQSKGYRVLNDSDPIATTANSSNISGDVYHFIKTQNSLNFIGFNSFLIHDEMDLDSVELLTIEYHDNEDVKVIKTPITKEDITKGSIKVSDEI